MNYTVKENVDHLATVLANVVRTNRLDAYTLGLLRKLALEADFGKAFRDYLLVAIDQAEGAGHDAR